jgi:hypothetical protein
VLVGVMGIQPMHDVDLVRHAYVLAGSQGRGVAHCFGHLRRLSTRRMLVGTWAAADGATRFYRRHGFGLVSPARKRALPKAYWIVRDRQIEISVVLANPPQRGVSRCDRLWRGDLMYFCHSSEIWQDFPELVAGSLFAEGITKDASVGPQIARFNAIAQSRLATSVSQRSDPGQNTQTQTARPLPTSPISLLP